MRSDRSINAEETLTINFKVEVPLHVDQVVFVPNHDSLEKTGEAQAHQRAVTRLIVVSIGKNQCVVKT